MTTPAFAPIYNGTYNADDPLVAPWFIPGWNAQAIPADTLKATSGVSFGPGFPVNLAYVNVVGNYFDANSAGLAGFITVRMSDNITMNDGGVTYRLPARYVGTMNMAIPFAYNNWGNQRLYLRLGRLDILLFATDQTASGSPIICDNGGTLAYWVTEHFLGGRTYQISVPSSLAGATTAPDINSLIVPGTIEPYQYDPVFPLGNDLTAFLDEQTFDVDYDGGTGTTPPSLNVIDGGVA